VYPNSANYHILLAGDTTVPINLITIKFQCEPLKYRASESTEIALIAIQKPDKLFLDKLSTIH
jgi:hypothetical protein